MATKATADNNAAEIVRRYLTFLANPDQLIDSGLVSKLEKRLSSETDQLERLKIHSAIELAKNIDAESLTDSFINVAAQYAKQENITASAFLNMGVPKDVLARAGLLAGGKTARKTAKRTSRRTVRTTKASSGKSAVVAGAKEFGDYFTVKDLVDASGASIGTVRKTIDEMIESSQLAEFDPDPDYTGRGRAPKRYKLL